MPIQQKLPPPMLLFSDFAGWEYISTSLIYYEKQGSIYTLHLLNFWPTLRVRMQYRPNVYKNNQFSRKIHIMKNNIYI